MKNVPLNFQNNANYLQIWEHRKINFFDIISLMPISDKIWISKTTFAVITLKSNIIKNETWKVKLWKKLLLIWTRQDKLFSYCNNAMRKIKNLVDFWDKKYILRSNYQSGDSFYKFNVLNFS